MVFFFANAIACATWRISTLIMDVIMDLNAPLDADQPVPIARPGVCGFCGLGTAFACPQCRTVHFCSADCLERGRDHVCGGPDCKAVDLPSDSPLDRTSGGMLSCWLNAYLRGGGHFSLHPQGGTATLRPSLTYGVVQLQVNPKAAADLSKVVINKRDTAGFLKIGTNSYPGFTDYTAIPGAHMHAHTHACTHACTHTCMHTHMHAHTHACTHACMHTCMHTHMHAHTHACTHACTTPTTLPPYPYPLPPTPPPTPTPR